MEKSNQIRAKALRKRKQLWAAAILFPLLLTAFGVRAGAESWAVYWYLCGSDLESEDGSASEDLKELTKTVLPDDVTFVIETGGSFTWRNKDLDADCLERLVYDKGGLRKLSSEPLQNMGEAGTLEDFLRFCRENYPADHQVLLLWDHGGGMTGGIAYDENYDYDSLSLTELLEALEGAMPLSAENPPLDIIGMDACLMATVDTACILSSSARYLVASEEWEGEDGWDYAAWPRAFSEEDLQPLSLCKRICDSYYAERTDSGLEDEATLSVVDLPACESLREAYEAFGQELLSSMALDPMTMTAFARNARASENYGGNNLSEGYSNLVDLGDLALRCEEDLSSAKGVLKALSSCVLYQVKGPSRQGASGLSCYYPYLSDEDNLRLYQQNTVSPSFASYYSFVVTEEMPLYGAGYLMEAASQAEGSSGGESFFASLWDAFAPDEEAAAGEADGAGDQAGAQDSSVGAFSEILSSFSSGQEAAQESQHPGQESGGSPEESGPSSTGAFDSILSAFSSEDGAQEGAGGESALSDGGGSGAWSALLQLVSENASADAQSSSLFNEVLSAHIKEDLGALPEGAPLEIDEDGHAFLFVDPASLESISAVYVNLCMVDEIGDFFLYLGQDNDLTADWERGIFTENFRSVWPAIDGHIVYLNVLQEAEDYTLFSCPVRLNGQEGALHVRYDYGSEAFKVLGVKGSMTENWMAGKDLTPLREGDSLTTLFYSSSLYGEDEVDLKEFETFTVGADPVFEETPLPDGSYSLEFEMKDYQNRSAYSQTAWIDQIEGEAQLSLF